MASDKLFKSGIIAVIRNLNPIETMYTIESLVKGGITGIEITANSESAFELIKEGSKQFGSEAVIGAGTVLDDITARKAIEYGADFIFSPSLDKKTVQVSKRYGKIAIPGTMTPTEIIKSYEYGADAVKVFPSSVLGPQFIKDIKAPLDHISVVPTGGINLKNAAEYIKAGALAVGVGSSLTNKQMILEKKWNELTDLAKEYVDTVQQARDS